MPSFVAKRQELHAELDKQLGLMPESETFYKISMEVVSHVPKSNQEELSQPEENKWAKVAQKIAQDNFLKGKTGENFEKQVRQFRDNFAMRPIVPTENK